MRQDNILKKLKVPQPNYLVAASNVTQCHMQPDHMQSDKQKLWMKERPGLCPERYCS